MSEGMICIVYNWKHKLVFTKELFLPYFKNFVFLAVFTMEDTAVKL